MYMHKYYKTLVRTGSKDSKLLIWVEKYGQLLCVVLIVKYLYAHITQPISDWFYDSFKLLSQEYRKHET